MSYLNLLDRYSSQRVLRNVEQIHDIGEKAAGTAEEFKAANLVKNEFERIGLENISLEDFSVVCRRYKNCELTLLRPFQKEILCGSAGTSISTPREGISGELIDAGFGTWKNYEKLREHGTEIDGKIALVDRNDRLTCWLDISCRLAHSLGIKAVIFANFVSEHTALRKDAFPFAPIPAVSIPYREAQQLRRALQSGKVILNLRNVIETDEKGVSYNVVGDLIGQQYTNELIILSAHHDSWFGGANDNAAGVAIILEIAEILKKNYRQKRTIRIISFGAEESGSQDYTEWSVGSFAYVKRHQAEAARTVVQINLDTPSYGDRIAVHTTPEIGPFAEKLTKDLELDKTFCVTRQPISGCDQWSFAMEGISSMTLTTGTSGYMEPGGLAYEKIYHTQYDTPDNLSYSLLEPAVKFLVASIFTLDSTEITPYDFASTLELIETHLSERLDQSAATLDVLGALMKTKELQGEVRRFNKVRQGGIVEKDRVESINDAQRRILRFLNPSIIGPGGDANKDVAWVIPECLDMLATLRTAIEALKSRDLQLAIESLSSLRSMNWGLNVNVDVYNDVLDSMLKLSRYPEYGICPNTLTELLSIKNKMRKVVEVSVEASSIQKQYGLVLEKVIDRLSLLETAITRSIQELRSII